MRSDIIPGAIFPDDELSDLTAKRRKLSELQSLSPKVSEHILGALLVGIYEDGKLKFGGRVGTGFSERLLKSLSDGLARTEVKAYPFFNLPAAGRGHLDPG